jgi:hypothetical protein
MDTQTLSNQEYQSQEEDCSPKYCSPSSIPTLIKQHATFENREVVSLLGICEDLFTDQIVYFQISDDLKPED